MELPKNPAAEDSVGVEAGRETDQEETSAEMLTKVELRMSLTAQNTTAKSDAESDDFHETAGLQFNTDQSAIKATDSDPEFEEVDEESRMGQTTSNLHPSRDNKSSDYETYGAEDPKCAEIPEGDEYTVEAIKSSRTDSSGKLEFLIKWKGQENLNWESEGNLLESASDILSNYIEENGGRERITHIPPQAKRKRGRPPKSDAPGPSEKAPKQKKQRVDSDPIYDKLDKMDKITVARDSCLKPNAEIPILPHQSNLKDGEGEDTTTASSGTKRGRGRPPKGKKAESPQEGHVAFGKDIVKRGRGRPPKAQRQLPSDGGKDFQGYETAKRGRGRPRKIAVQTFSQGKSITFGENGAKQGPGRPRKSDSLVSTHGKATVLRENGLKRGRGRPPKSKEPAVPQDSNGLAGNAAKRGRGRPPKYKGLV